MACSAFDNTEVEWACGLVMLFLPVASLSVASPLVASLLDASLPLTSLSLVSPLVASLPEAFFTVASPFRVSGVWPGQRVQVLAGRCRRIGRLGLRVGRHVRGSCLYATSN